MKKKRISYKPLFDLLSIRGLRLNSLRDTFSSTTLYRLVHNENVNTGTLVRLCERLGCNLNDIVEVVVDYDQ